MHGVRDLYRSMGTGNARGPQPTHGAEDGSRGRGAGQLPALAVLPLQGA